MEAKEYNFWSLTEIYHLVFPRIQRDYAQGRLTFKASQVRKAFIKSLKSALSEANPAVNLDFIYGVQRMDVKADETRFIPLDGQQRLTTLFLLHWYLAYKTNNHDVFKGHLSGKDEKVRFLYETRDSAKAFCENMIKNNIDNSDEQKPVSWNIRNQNWFLTMWTEDPTVQGMLTMLDAMDDAFKEDNLEDYWDRLTNKGYIRFYVLPFDENYSLGEDLYIKMNARGLALTTFENFKASFEEELLEVDTKESFKSHIDTKWTNMFWYPMTTEKGNPPEKVDTEMMRFIRMLLSFQYALRKDEIKEKEGEPAYEKVDDKVFDERIFGGLLVNAKGKDFIPDDEQNYVYLTEKGILDKDSAKKIVEGFTAIGDYWDNDKHSWEDSLKPIMFKDVWNTFCKKPDYRTQLFILAIIIAPADNRDCWFRLCRNLVCNTIINDKKDMRWLIKKLYELKGLQYFGLK
ncbi:MAG: DUF262 domain-containing protein [Bacteroidaceae bacterium]|nr:DUF262 domain-containing protein [Bacteroidaceae bacterium]